MPALSRRGQGLFTRVRLLTRPFSERASSTYHHGISWLSALSSRQCAGVRYAASVCSIDKRRGRAATQGRKARSVMYQVVGKIKPLPICLVVCRRAGIRTRSALEEESGHLAALRVSVRGLTFGGSLQSDVAARALPP